MARQPERSVELAHGRGIRRLGHAGDGSACSEAVVDPPNPCRAQLAGAGGVQVRQQRRDWDFPARMDIGKERHGWHHLGLPLAESSGGVPGSVGGVLSTPERVTSL
jgi:hypothetical protein